MIFAVLSLSGVGLWFLIAGDGPARIVGLLLLAVAGVFAVLVWIAVSFERPDQAALWQTLPEIHHG